MNDPRTQELLNGAVDDALAPAEREELKQLLERDPRANARLAELQKLTQAIEGIGQVDPPKELVHDVMLAISARRTSGARVAQGGMGMARKVMMGLAAAAAIVLGVFSITGYPPVGRGTEGSIDAAKRYQSEQIAAKDVVLGDTAAQQFLQSDVFDRLMRDDAARKLLSNAKYREAFAQIGVTKALGEDAVISALKNHEFMAVFSNSAALAAFDEAAFLEALGDSAFVDAIADTAVVRALSVEAFATALRNDVVFRLKFAEMAANGELSNLKYLKSIENVAVRNVVQDAQIAAAFSHDGLALKLKNQELANALTTSSVIAALRSSEVNAALKLKVFAPAFGSQEFRNLVAMKGIQTAFGDVNFEAAIQSGMLEMAIKQHGFNQAVASPQFEAALNKNLVR